MARKIRKANQNASFSRHQGKRAAYAKVLIVCEDTKSSKFYIEDLIRFLGLVSANVLVISGKGSAPINVIDTAIKNAVPVGDDPYDEVFCVIDRDTHTTFDSALNKLKTHDVKRTTKTKFKAIVSYPSFEIWILFHYKYTRSYFTGAKQVIQVIKTFGLDYEKADRNMFALTKNNFDTALINAKRSFKASLEDGERNPGTEFHLLVKALQEVKTS